MRHELISTVEELVDPVASARMAPMVLRSGPIRAEWAHFDVQGTFVEVGDYSFPVVTQGETLGGRISVLTPLRRTPGQVNGVALVEGLLHAGGEATEVQGALPGPVRAGVASVPIAVLEDMAVALGLDVDLPRRGEFRLVRAVEPGRLRELFDQTLRIARLTRDAALADRACRAIGDELTEIIVRSFERGGRTARPSRRHANSMCIVHDCADYADVHRYQGVTLAALCAASGVSERRVRQAFYECYEMSPTAYLRIAALHRVRNALLEAPPTRDVVTRTATDFGFWHLSRFAAQYRSLFGEVPSVTLSHRSSASAG